jgi:hypothetical protein
MIRDTVSPSAEEDQSPELKKQSSMIMSLSRSLSLKHIKEKIHAKRSSQAQVPENDYTPKTHPDNNGKANGVGLASYLYAAKSATWNSG